MYRKTLSWCVFTPGKELLIHASKLASCAGMNYFQDPLELAEEWHQAISGIKEPIFDVDAGIAALPYKVQGLIHAAKSCVYETPQEAVAAVEQIKKAVKEEEEEEEEEYIEIEIEDIAYCTNNEENGFIYELDKEGQPSKKVGYIKDGEPFFDE